MKKFKFSSQGNYFVVCGSPEQETIDVYDSSNDIESLLSVRVAKGQCISKIKGQEIKEAQKLVFSQDEQIILIGTNRVIVTYRIKDGQKI